jgi:hypothetical protein
MKKLITVIAIFTTTISYSQTISKEDSILQVEKAKFLDSLTEHTTVKQFQVWLYENTSFKAFQEFTFIQMYNIFLYDNYQLYLQKKKMAVPKK